MPPNLKFLECLLHNADLQSLDYAMDLPFWCSVVLLLLRDGGLCPLQFLWCDFGCLFTVQTQRLSRRWSALSLIALQTLIDVFFCAVIQIRLSVLFISVKYLFMHSRIHLPSFWELYISVLFTQHQTEMTTQLLSNIWSNIFVLSVCKKDWFQKSFIQRWVTFIWPQPRINYITDSWCSREQQSQTSHVH